MNNDLISREALKKAFEDTVCIEPMPYAFVKQIIDNAPTVEQPTGKWIYTDKNDKEKGFGGYCSVCKCDMPIGMNDWKQEYYESKYCPNCGAKMDGEDGEGRRDL